MKNEKGKISVLPLPPFDFRFSIFIRKERIGSGRDFLDFEFEYPGRRLHFGGFTHYLTKHPFTNG